MSSWEARRHQLFTRSSQAWANKSSSASHGQLRCRFLLAGLRWNVTFGRLGQGNRWVGGIASQCVSRNQSWVGQSGSTNGGQCSQLKGEFNWISQLRRDFLSHGQNEPAYSHFNRTVIFLNQAKALIKSFKKMFKFVCLVRLP